MSNQKNIDRLFQEQLKDVEVTPNPEIWKAIEGKLDKKKKRRVFPIWWFSGGIAASIILAMFFFVKTSESSKIQMEETPVVIQEDKEIDTKNIEKKPNKVEQIIVNQDEPESVSDKLTNANNSANEAIGKKEQENPSNSHIVKERSKTYASSHVNDIQTKDAFPKKANVEKVFTDKEQDVNSIQEDRTIVSVMEDKPAKPKPDKGAITRLDKEANDDFLIKKKETKKWKVNPIVGVLRTNTFSNTSLQNEDLNFSGQNNIAYGVNVENVISDKWAIKSGIQLQRLTFSSDINQVTSLKIIDIATSDSFSLNSEDMDTGASDELSNQTDNSGLDKNQDKIALSDGVERLRQNVSYVEIPLEAKYILLKSDNRELGLVSGFSALILRENEMSENTFENGAMISGLNKVNFSGNLGVDFNLSLLENLRVNLTPMFKVQLNTLSKEQSNFNPYVIGIYSGLSYEF